MRFELNNTLSTADVNDEIENSEQNNSNNSNNSNNTNEEVNGDGDDDSETEANSNHDADNDLNADIVTPIIIAELSVLTALQKNGIINYCKGSIDINTKSKKLARAIRSLQINTVINM